MGYGCNTGYSDGHLLTVVARDKESYGTARVAETGNIASGYPNGFTYPGGTLV